MLNLILTTDKLQLVTSAAVTVDVHASFMDLNAGAVTPGKQNTAITTATTTDIVAAPASSTQRNVKTLHIRNKHASSAVDVTVVFDANGTDYELHKETLRANESLEYIEGIGFFVLQTRTPDVITKLLVADQSNSTATATEVTGLTQAVGVGSYFFDYRLTYQSGATTTGVKWSVNHDGTVAQFVYWIEMLSATITAADGIIDQDVALTTGGLLNVNGARVKSTAGVGAGSISVDTANADVLCSIRGLMSVTVDGNLELWHASEVAAISTVKAGSGVVVTRLKAA